MRPSAHELSVSSEPHVFALTVTSGERRELLRLVERHGTPHLAGLLDRAVDMGSVRSLAASINAPGRMPGVRPAPDTRRAPGLRSAAVDLRTTRRPPGVSSDSPTRLRTGHRTFH
jgi:hypothetical protein